MTDCNFNQSFKKDFCVDTFLFSILTHSRTMTHIFILHRLRNKFLQLILISLDSASWELHQYSRRMCGPMKNPKVETRSRGSNSGPHDCKVDALPHDHGHHTLFFSNPVGHLSLWIRFLGRTLDAEGTQKFKQLFSFKKKKMGEN